MAGQGQVDQYFKTMVSTEAEKAEQGVFDVMIRMLSRVLDQARQLVGEVGGESQDGSVNLIELVVILLMSN